MSKKDLAVYPTEEQLLHKLFSADCRCKPAVEIIEGTAIYTHNCLMTNSEKEGDEKQRTTTNATKRS